MRILATLLTAIYVLFCFRPTIYAQREQPEPLPNYNELFDAVFSESDSILGATSTSFTSTLPIATTLIEPYQNYAAGGYGFLVDWDPNDSYPTGTILHPALDYNLGGGTADAHQPVISPGPGQIAYAGWLSETWGGVVAQQIRLRGGEHIWVFLAHLGIDGTVPFSVGAGVTAHNDILVEADAVVAQQEVLGYLARGVASGDLREIDWSSHLHWEVRHIDHNKWNVGLWPGWNQPLSTYLERVVHPAKFMDSYNSEDARLYEGIYLGYDAYEALHRPQELVVADPRRQTSAYGIGLHNLPVGFQARSMVVPEGLQVEIFSGENGEGISRTFTNPVMNFDSIGELNQEDAGGSGKSDMLGFVPRAILVAQVSDSPTPTESPTATPTEMPSRTPMPTVTATIAVSPSGTATEIYMPTPSPGTPVPSVTVVTTPTSTPASTLSPTLMPTATATVIVTPTSTPVLTNRPTHVATPTVTPVVTETLLLTETPPTTGTPALLVTYRPTDAPSTISATVATALPTTTITYTLPPSATSTVTMEPTDSATAVPTGTATVIAAPAPISRDATLQSATSTPVSTDVVQQEADALEGGTAQLLPCHLAETVCHPNDSETNQIYIPFMAGP